jgi:hypothetical protein
MTPIESLINRILPFIDRTKVSDVELQRIVEDHLIMEKEQKIEFACKVVEVSSEKYIQGKTTEQIAKELLTFKSE